MRYNKIYTFEKPLYTHAAPVVIEKIALFYDSFEKRRVIFSKIRSVTDKIITSVKVTFVLYDKEGKRISDGQEYTYDGVSVGTDDTFGEKVPVYAEVKGAWKCLAKVSEVSFADESVWTPDTKARWLPVTPSTLIDQTITDSYTLKGYKSVFGEGAIYVYEKRDDIQICTCGAINTSDSHNCRSCGASFSQLENLDIAALKKEGLYQTAKSGLESKCSKKKMLKIRSAFLFLKDYKDSVECLDVVDDKLEEKKKRQRKINLIAIPSACAAFLGIIALIVFLLIIPLSRISKADEHFINKQYRLANNIYEEYDNFARSRRGIAAINARDLLVSNKASSINKAVDELNNAGIETAIYAYDNISGETVVISTLLNAPKKYGYLFNGWKFEKFEYDISNKNSVFKIFVETNWIRTYTVKFDDNYYYGYYDHQVEVLEGQRLDIPEEPTRYGYVFVGWYTDISCINPYDFSQSVTSDMTLYAKWLRS